VDWTDPATNQSGSIAVEFIHDKNIQEDSWYVLYQSEGRKPWYTDTSRWIAYDNVYGLGWWNIDDPQHPDFIRAGPSSQSAPQLQQSTSQQSQPHEEFAAGALHHVATIHDTDPQDETPVITQQIYIAAASGLQIPTNIPPVTLQAPQTMSQPVASVTVPATGTSPQTQSNGGGTVGSPPEPFNGDRNRSKDFMRAFIQWWKLNYDKPVFQEPYKRVALCLNYMKGRNVEDWTDDRQAKMDADVAYGQGHNEEHHWNEFKAAFDLTYTNIGEAVNAEHEIERLRMEKGDLDTYIATFNKLAGLAGYSPSDRGALALFKKGLPMPLNLSIVQHTNPRPDTLVDWQKAAREQQLKYLQTREF